MSANQPHWPCEWLMTDERIGDRLWEAIDALPIGAGIVFRHYATPATERSQLAHRVAVACQDRKLVLAIARDGELARELGAKLVHNPDRQSALPCSLSIHNHKEAQAARPAGAALVFISPVYSTRSHLGTPALGAARAAELAALSGCRAVALGGMNAARFDALEAAFPGTFHGYAGIDCWLGRQLRT